MERKQILISAVVVGLLLALAVGMSISQAQEPEPSGESETAIQGEVGTLAAADVVSNAISYQGVLKENGNPVNGTRAITFTLYSDASCSTVEDTIVKSSVPITDGLFSVKLGVDQRDFNGQALWLAPEVNGTVIGCQEIMAAPYALSLRPGASISRETLLGSNLNVYNGSPGGLWMAVKAAISAWTNDGIAVRAVADSGTALSAHSNSGDAGYFNGRLHVRREVSGNSTTPDENVVFFENTSTTNQADLMALKINVATPGAQNNYIQFLDSDNNGSGRIEGNGSGGVTYESTGADFAEMLPAQVGLAPTEVLVIGPDGRLERSTEPYQSSVVGVYSSAPGFVGGAASQDEAEDVTAEEEDVPLAIVGVVPVKASAENGVIQPGDLLVTSSTPGHAMKTDGDPPQGTVIGKALEGLDSDTGVIKMLVMLQ